MTIKKLFLVGMDLGDMINSVCLLSNVHIWFDEGRVILQFNNISHLYRVQEIEILISSQNFESKINNISKLTLEERKMSCCTEINSNCLYFTFEKCKLAALLQNNKTHQQLEIKQSVY